MSEPPLTIVIDDRERRSGIIDRLRRYEAVRCVVRRLAVGDYALGPNVIVERKTVADFALSLMQGRLFDQAARLARSGRRPLMILEGRFEVHERKHVSRAGLQGAMIALTLRFGIPVIRSLDVEETAWLLCSAAGQVARGACGAVGRFGYRPKGLLKRRLYVLQGLPGIGVKRAALLLKTFGSLEAVFGAEEEELAEADGIGPLLAARLREVIGSRAKDRCARD